MASLEKTGGMQAGSCSLACWKLWKGIICPGPPRSFTLHVRYLTPATAPDSQKAKAHVQKKAPAASREGRAREGAKAKGQGWADKRQCGGREEGS